MSFTRILVVDDFLPWHRFIREIVESDADLQVIAVAADGFEAVQKAIELKPDLILMDVSLPGMNGFQAAQQIRTSCPESKILFLSEHRDSDHIKVAFDVGGSGYVLKTDSKPDLVRGIKCILGGQQYVSQSLKDWGSIPH